jgi:ketosteroid isomerase-like protein
VAKQNVEKITRDAYDAFNQRDLEAILTYLDPNIEWWPAADELIIEPYRGHDGYRRLFAEVLEVSPDIQSEIEELFVVGDQVVACLRYWGRGRESGAPVELRETHVARLRAGKFVEVREYRERDQALEAVGLSG